MATGAECEEEKRLGRIRIEEREKCPVRWTRREMEERNGEAVVMPAMGRRSERTTTMTERVRRRRRRDVGGEDVDRLGLCGDEEEEERDVDIRESALKMALMPCTTACDGTSAGAKDYEQLKPQLDNLQVNRQRERKIAKTIKHHVPSSIRHQITSFGPSPKKRCCYPAITITGPRRPAHFHGGSSVSALRPAKFSEQSRENY